MLSTMDEKLRKQITKDGSHLKYARSFGGAGAGLMTAGIGFFLAFFFLAVALGIMPDFRYALILIPIGLVIGAIFFVPGFLLHKKRLTKYLAYYTKKSSYTESELQSFEQEFQSPSALFINPHNRLNSTARRDGGIITDHWIKMPYMFSISYTGIYRLVDVAAIWFEKTPFINSTQLNPSVFLIDSIGTMIYCQLTESVAMELIQEVAKRNPNVITSRYFSVGDQSYDAQRDPQEVAKLYRMSYSKRA